MRRDVLARPSPAPSTAAVNWYRAMDAGALADLLPVSIPTLYVWSTGDRAFGRAAAEGTAEHVLGPYTFEVLEGVSHWVPETAPAAALRAAGPAPLDDLTGAGVKGAERAFGARRDSARMGG